ncbi:MAG TPA: ATP-binding cassette domain-containing protein, partial [Bacteroidia bacterium]|nr:ATP-binding cassette domain-containing protein [Bacteroidia bacterium]
MITIDKVVTGYGDRMVLNELSLNMKEGIIHGLVGLNGSGKSTLLKCLSSQMQIRSGQILKNGVKISRKEISMLETDPFFYHGINGREYLSLFNSDNKDKFNLNEWQSLFNIPLDHLIDGYSTGMKKKLAIVGILKADKPILLFDEPFNGLDIEAAKVFSMV